MVAEEIVAFREEKDVFTSLVVDFLIELQVFLWDDESGKEVDGDKGDLFVSRNLFLVRDLADTLDSRR